MTTYRIKRENRTGAVLIDFTPQQLILRLCALLFIAGVHGAVVAGTAVALGDPGPRHDARLSLNPFAQLDILGSMSALLFSVGWIRPIAIDPAELRPGRAGLALIVIAGAAATLLSALALRLARPMVLPLLPDTASSVVFALIETTGQLSLWFALCNLLPLPCLTGGHLLTAVMPPWRNVFWRSGLFAAVLLAALAATGLVTGLLAPAYRMLAGPILGE
jgi:Zn-dependent protease